MYIFKKELMATIKGKAPLTTPRETWLDKIPEVKPLPAIVGVVVFGGLAVIGVSIGAAIGTYVFFGTATLTGFIALVESNKYLKYIVVKSNRFIDFAIFGLTIFATITLGVTITAALTFAGLGYSLVYAPYVRQSQLN